MRRFIPLALAVALTTFAPVGRCADQPEAGPTADEALQKLKDGNGRFVADKPAEKYTGAAARAELANGQSPYAIVLSCADSRVPPELVFDAGLGHLFVVRVAGNVSDPEILGSMEYAVTKLKVPLIVVLGHEECGAVHAAVEGGEFKGNLQKLISEVHTGGDLPRDKDAALSAAVRANVLYQAAQLTKDSDVLRDFVKSGRVRIVSGVYSLKTGEVGWLQAGEK